MAETYNVYFGTPGNLVQIAEEQAGLSIVVPYNLEYNTVYNWRVDATNEYGTTTGDTWSFTVLVLSPPTISTGVGGAGDFTGENNMLTVNRLISAANNKIWYEDL